MQKMWIGIRSSFQNTITFNMNYEENIKSISYFLPSGFDNEVMLILRKKSPRKGYFGLVGGHAHVGETVTQALHREVQEEIGAKILKMDEQIIRLIGPDNTDIDDDYFKDVKVLSPQIKDFSVERMNICEANVNAFCVPNKTVYYLFSGRLEGDPVESEEVIKVQWNKIDDWIVLANDGRLKIQPVDLFLLSIL